MVQPVWESLIVSFKIKHIYCSHEIKRLLTPWKKIYDQPRQHIQKQRHDFADEGPSSQGYGFSSGHVWMSELDCEES